MVVMQNFLVLRDIADHDIRNIEKSTTRQMRDYWTTLAAKTIVKMKEDIKFSPSQEKKDILDSVIFDGLISLLSEDRWHENYE